MHVNFSSSRNCLCSLFLCSSNFFQLSTSSSTSMPQSSSTTFSFLTGHLFRLVLPLLFVFDTAQTAPEALESQPPDSWTSCPPLHSTKKSPWTPHLFSPQPPAGNFTANLLGCCFSTACNATSSTRWIRNRICRKLSPHVPFLGSTNPFAAVGNQRCPSWTAKKRANGSNSNIIQSCGRMHPYHKPPADSFLGGVQGNSPTRASCTWPCNQLGERKL